MNSPAPLLPRSILLIGWSTAFAAIAMMVMNIASLTSSAALEELIPSSLFLNGQAPPSLQAVLDVYELGRYWMMFTTLFFVFVLVAALQFLRLRSWGRQALEAACWIGIMGGVVDAVFSYSSWNAMRIAMSDLMGQYGGGLAGAQQLGVVSILLGFLLWGIPCVALMVFVRSAAAKQAMLH